MDRRTYESPMDWEYQNNAPVDPSSPFVQSTKRLQAKGMSIIHYSLSLSFSFSFAPSDRNSYGNNRLEASQTSSQS